MSNYLSFFTLTHRINSVNTKQKKQSRDKIENKEIEDDYLFYDLGEQGDVNVLDAQPVKSLGLIKKKKHTDTKNMLIKSIFLISFFLLSSMTYNSKATLEI